MKVACIQLNSQEDKAANVATAIELTEKAAAEGARLVALPETWTYRGRRAGLASSAERADGPSNALLAGIARRRGVFILAGSLYEPTETPGMYSNVSVLFDPEGEAIASYRKVHLFDALSGTAVYRESDELVAGGELATADVDGVTVGLSICYDLRFPELYRALAVRGARILLVPSAFTMATGRDHWETLLRARAIENGCFVVAPNQWGPHPPERLNFGHSMVVDPWGTVLATADEGVGMCVADIDLAMVDRVRDQLPALAHRRPDLYRGWE
jgi:deaminated glutathione amidase